MYSKLASYIDRFNNENKLDFSGELDDQLSKSTPYNPFVVTPDERVFGQLGDVIFTISSGIDSLAISSKYNFAKNDIITGKPTLQKIGIDVTKIKLRINIY